MQLGSNLENLYVASLTSLTPPRAAAVMEEEIYYKKSLFQAQMSLGRAAGSCFPQHSPLTAQGFGVCSLGSTGGYSPSPWNTHWELQLLLTGISGPFSRVCQWCASSWTSLWNALELLFPLAPPCLCELNPPGQMWSLPSTWKKVAFHS